MIYRIYFRRKSGSAWSDPNVLLVKGTAERDRILSRKTPIAVAWEKAKLYRCAGCGRRGPWDKDWAWRGGWSAIEEDGPVEAACSMACLEPLPPREDEFGRRMHWIGYEPLSREDRARRQTVGMNECERAQLQRDRRTVPLFPDWKGASWCRWCGEKIVDKRAPWMNWHRGCKRTWLLHYDRGVQTDFLITRDGWDCWDCRRGGRWIRVDLVLARWPFEAFPTSCPPAKFDWKDKLPEDLALRKVDGVIVGLYSSVRWQPLCGGLEVDHEIPLWSIWHLPDDERRRFYGPENIRLRCNDCHKAKSKREAAQRALIRAREKAGGPIDLGSPAPPAT